MPSDVAKKAAGTYIPDAFPLLPAVRAWFTTECRSGVFAVAVKTFCEAQPEVLDQSLVLVESITSDCIQCRIPCRHYDSESDNPFDTEVLFTLDPQKGECKRV